MNRTYPWVSSACGTLRSRCLRFLLQSYSILFALIGLSISPLAVAHAQQSSTAGSALFTAPRNIEPVLFSPDGTLLASAVWQPGGTESSVWLWDVASRQQVATFQLGSWNNELSFSPDGTLLATGGDATWLWDVASRQQVATLQHEAYGLSGISAVSFSPDGTLLATGTYGETLLWDVASRQEVATLQHGAGRSESVSFSPDGTLLASVVWQPGGTESSVWLWDVASRQQVATLQHEAYELLAVSFSPDGTLLATIGEQYKAVEGKDYLEVESSVWLWDVASRQRQEVATFQYQELGSFRSLSFSPDGTLLAIAEHRGTLLAIAEHRFSEAEFSSSVWLWDVASRQRVATLWQDEYDDLASLSFSPDGTLLAIAGFRNLGYGPEGKVWLQDVSEWVGDDTLTKVFGDGQGGQAGEPLAKPFVISLLDQNGSALAGEIVRFSVSAGGGTLSTTIATTNASGHASTTLTLGPDPGTNTVTATVEGLRPVTFTANGRAPADFDEEEADGEEDGELDDFESSGEDQPETAGQPTTAVELKGIAASHDSIREDGTATTITVTVTLDRAAATDETITLAIVSPLVGKPAQRGEDFDATFPETLTIAKGQRTGAAQLTLTPKDNATADGDKAFAVQATSSSGHAALINIKIIGNDLADEPQARLTPDPSAVEFSADDPAWKTFTVHTNLDSVLVRANPPGSDPALEVAGGQQVPTRDFCPAEGNDRPTRGRRDGWSLHVKACQAGQTKILLIDYDTGEVVQQYEVNVEASSNAAVTTALNPSYPNPFNSETVLSYTLPTASDIRLEVFTLSGQRVAVLHEGFQAAGYHTIAMDASDLASGVYLYRLSTPQGRFTQKFTLLR